MVYYNTSFTSDLTGAGSLFNGINTEITGGLLAIFLVVLVFGFATMVSTRRFDDFRIGVMIGTSTSMLFAPLLWMAGALPFWISIITFILFIIAILINTVWRRN